MYAGVALQIYAIVIRRITPL